MPFINTETDGLMIGLGMSKPDEAQSERSRELRRLFFLFFSIHCSNSSSLVMMFLITAHGTFWVLPSLRQDFQTRTYNVS